MTKQSYILVAIDGTWSIEFQKENPAKDSFVKRFYKEFNPMGGDKLFLHGPNGLTGGVLGLDGAPRISMAKSFIAGALRYNSDARICLVGWSRGAHIAIQLAKQIRRVYFMGLFDAVDRTPFHDSDTISNVDHAYHAMRDTFFDYGINSLFGSTGSSSVTGLYSETFKTTHAGVGGFPGKQEEIRKALTRKLTQSLRVRGDAPMSAFEMKQHNDLIQELEKLAEKKSLEVKSQSEKAYEYIKSCAKKHGLQFNS